MMRLMRKRDTIVPDLSIGLITRTSDSELLEIRIPDSIFSSQGIKMIRKLLNSKWWHTLAKKNIKVLGCHGQLLCTEWMKS